MFFILLAVILSVISITSYYYKCKKEGFLPFNSIDYLLCLQIILLSIYVSSTAWYGYNTFRKHNIENKETTIILEFVGE